MSVPASTSGAPAPDAAKRASGSSFYTAMRILPAAQRQAMFEIYSFCRAVDDIADEGGTREERSAGLAEWRRTVDALYTGDAHAVAQHPGLVEAIRSFGLRREDFLAIIDGMEMDAREDIRAPDWATLDLYCDRVASAVGRLSVRVFGMPEAEGRALAHHLGRALQLTNILRDVDEDAAIGRLYLPREALAAHGMDGADPQRALASASLGPACAPVIARAKEHFAQAEAIMARHPRKVVRAPRIMGAAYRLILDGIEARGFAAPRTRVRISRGRLAAIILRYAFV